MPPQQHRARDGRFPPGTSGNPGGRSKRLRELDAAIAAKHDAATVLDVIGKLRELALAGDVQAAKAYLDRVAGPVRPDDDARFEAAVECRLSELIEEARARRATGADDKPGQISGDDGDRNQRAEARS
jgi:hypothetical protein